MIGYIHYNNLKLNRNTYVVTIKSYTVPVFIYGLPYIIGQAIYIFMLWFLLFFLA